MAEVGSRLDGSAEVDRLLADLAATTAVWSTGTVWPGLIPAIWRQPCRLGADGSLRPMLVRPTMIWFGDTTEVLPSFCDRMHGRRGARNRAVKALGCAKNDAVLAGTRKGRTRAGDPGIPLRTGRQ